MRILIIEDNPDIAANLGDYLEDQGHTVDFAGDGVTGLHLAVVGDFDAIVLDLALPGMDGLEVCRILRRERDVPIIMLTSVAQATGYTFKPEEHPDFFPVDQFLEKPVPPTTLVRKIREALEKGE